MPYSPTSSDAGVARPPRRKTSGTVLDIVGGTPLLRLSRSGEGRVFVKHEGYQPSGSLFDRVARRQIPVRTDCSWVVAAADAFALAVVARCAAVGAAATVIGGGAEWKRMVPLLAVYGVKPVRASSPEEVQEHLAAAVSEGATELRRDDEVALSSAFVELRDEVLASLGQAPSVWVVPGFGGATTFGAFAGTVDIMADDGERERRLDGAAACRRAQSGQREGMLLSPLGAEIVDRAVNRADDVSGAVVAVVPEGGHRYLGWW